MAYTIRFFATLAAITFALATNAQLIDKKALTLIKPEQKQIVPEKTLPKVSDRYLL